MTHARQHSFRSSVRSYHAVDAFAPIPPTNGTTPHNLHHPMSTPTPSRDHLAYHVSRIIACPIYTVLSCPVSRSLSRVPRPPLGVFAGAENTPRRQSPGRGAGFSAPCMFFAALPSYDSYHSLVSCQREHVLSSLHHSIQCSAHSGNSVRCPL